VALKDRDALEAEVGRRPFRNLSQEALVLPDVEGPPGIAVQRNDAMCSSGRTPCRLLRRMLARMALRTSIGSRRRSVPFSSKVESVGNSKSVMAITVSAGLFA
jgi:hypothetical protein